MTMSWYDEENKKSKELFYSTIKAIDEFLYEYNPHTYSDMNEKIYKFKTDKYNVDVVIQRERVLRHDGHIDSHPMYGVAFRVNATSELEDNYYDRLLYTPMTKAKLNKLYKDYNKYDHLYSYMELELWEPCTSGEKTFINNLKKSIKKSL